MEIYLNASGVFPSEGKVFKYDTPITDRPLAAYLMYLQVGPEDLGQHVLDLGSGTTQQFAREAAEYGIEVVSVNPQLSDSSTRNSLIISGHRGMSVAAVAQQLPFRDNEFDSVVSLFAVPYHIPTEDLELTFGEVYRVLKENRTAYLSPVMPNEVKLFETILKKMGRKYALNKLPESLGPDMFPANNRQTYALQLMKES